MIPRAVLIVAHHAGRIQRIIERSNPVDILSLREFVCFAADVDQHLRLHDPILLVARAAIHHEQVSGLRQHQRLSPQIVPVLCSLGLVAVHVKKYKETGAELAMGQARFTGPKTLEVSLMMEDRERFSASGVFAIPSWTMA